MKLSSLDLEEFRAYRRLHLEIEPAGLRLYGSNASGKTSLLEAIAMLATTRSSRTSTERDLIAWDSGESYGVPPYARCSATVDSSLGPFNVSLSLEAGTSPQGTLKKDIRIDGRPTRAMDAVGRLKAVLFSVEDVALVSGAPQGRRRYLDLTISQLDGRYLRSLSGFNRVLAQRNSLLKSFARERVHHADATVGAQLAFWDEELVRYGSLVFAYRITAVQSLSALLRTRFMSLASDREANLEYRPNLSIVGPTSVAEPVDVDAMSGVVARNYVDALQDVRRDEVRRGMTLIGPHRDDLGFTVDGADLAAFGSRGEQRLAVVALKLAEADLLRRERDDPPVLLLDDVLSELDEHHREQLIVALAGLEGQLFVTATDRTLFRHSILGAIPEAMVESGTVIPTN